MCIRDSHEEDIVNDEGYTPEPDIFHDVQGHIPLLANTEYSNFLHKVGILGDKIIKNELGLSRDLVDHNLKRLQNFAWWTYEFGLLKKQNVNTDNDIDYEIYGSGILSSQSEILNIVNCAKNKSDQSVFLPYDIDEIILTSFNYSNIQEETIETDNQIGVSTGAKTPRKPYTQIKISEGTQTWSQDNTYPILPRIDKFGVFEQEVNVLNSYGSDDAPITNLQDNDGDLIFDLDLGTSTTDDIIDKTEINKINYNQDIELSLDRNLRLEVRTPSTSDTIETDNIDQAF